MLDQIVTLLNDFSIHNERYNLLQATKRLDKALSSDLESIETVLILDADRIFAAEDTGKLF